MKRTRNPRSKSTFLQLPLPGTLDMPWSKYTELDPRYLLTKRQWDRVKSSFAAPSDPSSASNPVIVGSERAEG